jgi:multiple sugar transport system substrate-binding protein
MFHFMSMSASYVVRGGSTVDRCTNNYWFDPATMEPLINQPGHVKALAKLIELSQYGPDAQVGWDLGTAWDWFLRGKSIFVFSWGDVGALVQDTARSKIQGKLGASILPGSTEVYNMCSNAWETLETPNVAGNTTGGSWHGIISSRSLNPEVVYHLYAFMATKPVHLWNIYRGWTGVDPGVSTDFLPPNGTATMEGFKEVGWNESDVEFYTQAYYDNFFAPVMLPYLRINGTEEYWRALDQNLSKAMVGELDPQTALDNTAAAWNEITERRGKDLQLSQYQQSMGYQP